MGSILQQEKCQVTFFSFFPHNENIYFIIADVAGKGIHAGMVMAKASTLFEVLSQSKCRS